MFGAYYWGQPYYGEAEDVDQSLLIRHFWLLPSKSVSFDNADEKTLTFDKDL